MISELRTASRVICQRLRERPYQQGVTITAWNAVVDQLLDGSRSGAFSWHKAVKTEVHGYIAELDEETKRRIWESTEDAELIPNASIETITECLTRSSSRPLCLGFTGQFGIESGNKANNKGCSAAERVD